MTASMINISQEVARSVILFTEAISIIGLEHLLHQVRRITIPMLYHYATAEVEVFIKINTIIHKIKDFFRALKMF